MSLFSCSLFVAILFFLSCCSFPSVAAKRSSDSLPAIRPLRPLVDCQVCSASINAFAEYVKRKSAEAPEPKENNKNNKKKKSSQSKFSEEQLIDWAEQVCDEKSESGEWLHQMDIVSAQNKDNNEENISPEELLSKDDFQTLISSKTPKASSLFVLSPRSYGECRSKCFTLRSSCEYVHTSGLTEWVEQFYSSSSSVEDIISSTCNSFCSNSKQKSAVKSLNYDSWKQIVNDLNKDGWKSKTKEERDMEAMMAQMEAMGMGGGMDMFSRDDLDNMDLGSQQDGKNEEENVHDEL